MILRNNFRKKTLPDGGSQGGGERMRPLPSFRAISFADAQDINQEAMTAQRELLSKD